MKPFLACLLSIALIFSTAGCGGRVASSVRATTPQAQLTEAELDSLLAKPFVEVFDYSTAAQVPKKQVETFAKALDEQEGREKKRLKQEEDRLKSALKDARSDLKKFDKGESRNVSDPQRTLHLLQCRVTTLERELQKNEVALKSGLDRNFDTKEAKLKVLAEWPDRHATLQQLSHDERLSDRQFADFRNIGVRGGPFENQEDDIAVGQRVMSELMQQKLLPPPVQDRAVNDYVQRLGNRIARNSDLDVPLRVFVLHNKEINAMALPGGYLIVNTGLIAKADNEAELAGVLAHEMAHSAARHGRRLQRRANILNLLFTGAQVAAMIFTGGAVASLGAAYALDYGFQALGLILSLNMLGVSRGYEIEADVLGTQYLWKSGYNTRGFMSFFDKMAQETGYVDGASWFRTHPPFYERMEASYEQIVLLPNPRDVVDDTTEFHRVRDRVLALSRDAERRDLNAPSLRRELECRDGENHLRTTSNTTRQYVRQYYGCDAGLR